MSLNLLVSLAKSASEEILVRAAPNPSSDEYDGATSVSGSDPPARTGDTDSGSFRLRGSARCPPLRPTMAPPHPLTPPTLPSLPPLPQPRPRRA